MERPIVPYLAVTAVLRFWKAEEMKSNKPSDCKKSAQFKYPERHSEAGREQTYI